MSGSRIARVGCLTLAVLLAGARADAGGGVGNGGDSVFCRAEPQASEYDGWYNLDYLVNKVADVQYAGDFEKMVGPDEAFDTHILRLIQAFKESGHRIFHQDLKEFHEQLWSNQFARRYVWKKAPHGLGELQDEGLKQKVPPNCLGAAGDGTYVQTIIRTRKNWSMPIYAGTLPTWGADFAYATKVVAELPPLQLSFLLLHEWLRTFTDDPEKIRDANAILHSEGWSPEEVDAKLQLLVDLRLDGVARYRVYEGLRAPYRFSAPDLRAQLGRPVFTR
jgi:hypothetical protein